MRSALVEASIVPTTIDRLPWRGILTKPATLRPCVPRLQNALPNDTHFFLDIKPTNHNHHLFRS